MDNGNKLGEPGNLASRLATQGQISGKRTGKDSVFTHLFGEPEYRFQLFQTLHPELKDVTMSDIIPLTSSNILLDQPYNDLGFLVGNILIILVEAQSTWSINILIRLILYVAQKYNDLINAQGWNVYGTKALELPEPEFYVIYTGDRKERPEEINFSRAFFGGRKVGLDATAKVIYGGQDDIISQYVTFCHVLDEQYRKFGRTAEAVREAIRICKDMNVLKKYLEEREKEVISIMLTLFDQETAERNYAASIDREARADERQKSLLGTIKSLMKTMKWSPTEAMTAMEIPTSQQSIYAAQL